MGYLALELNPPLLFKVRGELRIISLGKNSYNEWNLEARLTPLPLFYVGLGYRSENLKLDQNNVKANLSFSGIYAVLGLVF